jgi:hypothetical protein
MAEDPTPPLKKEESSGNEPLSEKDFIQNGWSFFSLPFWLWIFLIAALTGVILGTVGWYHGFLQKEKRVDPFLEVTNREFSVFLWQFPSFLRNNTPKKSGYLSGFLPNSENFNPETGEEFVSAPPDLIFLYHTWSRLLAPDFIARPINPSEFNEFLSQLTEWQPVNWKKAPPEYIQLIESKSYSKMENLQILPDSSFPLIVRRAFQGWKNYYKEGEKINDLQPTYARVKAFLERHPSYARPFWRNIAEVNGQKVAGLNYLSGFQNPSNPPDSTIPKDQIASFLKVALFNDLEAQQKRSP